jgi:hypothetical protein
VVHAALPAWTPGQAGQSHADALLHLVSVSVFLSEQQQQALSGSRDRGLLGLNGARSNREEFLSA